MSDNIVLFKKRYTFKCPNCGHEYLFWELHNLEWSYVSDIRRKDNYDCGTRWNAHLNGFRPQNRAINPETGCFSCGGCPWTWKSVEEMLKDKALIELRKEAK